MNIQSKWNEQLTDERRMFRRISDIEQLYDVNVIVRISRRHSFSRALWKVSVETLLDYASLVVQTDGRNVEVETLCSRVEPTSVISICLTVKFHSSSFILSKTSELFIFRTFKIKYWFFSSHFFELDGSLPSTRTKDFSISFRCEPQNNNRKKFISVSFYIFSPSYC